MSRAMNDSADSWWVWSPYSTEPGLAFVTEFGGLSDDNARRLVRGERLAGRPRLVVRSHEPGRFADQLGDYIGLRIVSPVLRAVLQATERANVQFVSVGVPGRPSLRYAVANVLDVVPALDVERSDLERFPGTVDIADVRRFVARDIAPDAPPIFHVAEYRPLVLVADHLRRALQAASNEPGVLTPLQEWGRDY